MKNFLSLMILVLAQYNGETQIAAKLESAYKKFNADPQLRYATSSLLVVDAKTGKVVFGRNQHTGLAPASTQKIITSVTAYELLGRDFRYKTQLAYDGRLKDGILDGNFYIIGEGDPTLGSWRWSSTRDSIVIKTWTQAVRKAGIRRSTGSLLFDPNGFSAQNIPSGWIWEDLGNYYGAASHVLNWKENQLDLTLRSGAEIGSAVEIVEPERDFINELKAAKQGSGDNAYAYLPTDGTLQVLAGTIPVNEKAFKISIADPTPVSTLLTDLGERLKESGVEVPPYGSSYLYRYGSAALTSPVVLGTILSPALDSIIFWFNRKSVNLYGEALVKTFAHRKNGRANTADGVEIMKDFWKQQGLEEGELNLYDGSGLSPLNRLTAHAQVTILQFAKSKKWFPSFFDALPEYNGMKMKSGTISNVKGFCGYHTSKDGHEYIFSFLVNNYNGNAGSLVNKMYTVLNILK